MKAQLIEIGEQNKEARLSWYCPGCKSDHEVPVPPHPQAWEWNGSLESPTLSPSILIDYGGRRDKPTCHCFVRNGRIEFLGDCSHDHAGKTVEMTSKQ